MIQPIDQLPSAGSNVSPFDEHHPIGAYAFGFDPGLDSETVNQRLGTLANTELVASINLRLKASDGSAPYILRAVNGPPRGSVDYRMAVEALVTAHDHLLQLDQAEAVLGMFSDSALDYTAEAIGKKDPYLLGGLAVFRSEQGAGTFGTWFFSRKAAIFFGAAAHREHHKLSGSYSVNTPPELRLLEQIFFKEDQYKADVKAVRETGRLVVAREIAKEIDKLSSRYPGPPGPVESRQELVSAA